MVLIPAPMRQFRTYSMLLVIGTGVLNLGVILTHTLSELHVVSATNLAIIDAVLMFVIGTVRMIQQQVTTTTQEKVAIVEFAAAQPMAPKQPNVVVEIEGAVVPQVPPVA